MEFLKTDEGLIHGGRIGAILYTLALMFGCWDDAFDRMCAVRLVFTLGWWLALGGKHVLRTFADLTAQPMRMVGIAFAVLGIAGQFYITWVRHHGHL